MPAGDNLTALQAALAAFASDRDWAQFHTPKNLVMALVGEVGELAELFQWLTPEQSASLTAIPKDRQRVEEELADVFGYVLRLADVLDVDLPDALTRKIESNAVKYPVHLAHGNATKYDQLER